MKHFLIFILAAVVITAFHPVTGLKCYSHLDDRLCDRTIDGEVVECSGPNPGCSISEKYASLGDLGVLKSCFKRCLDDLDSGQEGCQFIDLDDDGGYINICFCRSDGCNIDFDTAGGFTKHV